MTGKIKLCEPPHVLGHEICGEIVETGKNANADFVGKRVVVETYVGCGKCEFCKKGMKHLCEAGEIGYPPYQGGEAEYVCVPESCCHFLPDEITDDGGNLPENYDPKCAWALRNLDRFPIEINRADMADLLRVPGIGVRSALRIRTARRYAKLTFEDLVKMRVVMKRAVHFITCNGKFFGSENPATIKNFLIAAENGVNYKQLSMFENGYSNVQTIISKRENNAALAALTGEL